jgi:hypothetical protein
MVLVAFLIAGSTVREDTVLLQQIKGSDWAQSCVCVNAAGILAETLCPAVFRKMNMNVRDAGKEISL